MVDLAKIISDTKVTPYPSFSGDQETAFQYIVSQLHVNPRDAYSNLNISIDSLQTTLSNMTPPSNVSPADWTIVKDQILTEMTDVSNIRLLFGNMHSFVQDVFIGKTQLLSMVGNISKMESTYSVSVDVLGIFGAVISAIGAITGAGAISTLLNTVLTLAKQNWGSSINNVNAAYVQLEQALNAEFNNALATNGKMETTVLSDWGKLQTINQLIIDGTLVWPPDDSAAVVKAEIEYEIGLWQAMIPIAHHVEFSYYDRNKEKISDPSKCPCVTLLGSSQAYWLTLGADGGYPIWYSPPNDFCARLAYLGISLNDVIFNYNGQWSAINRSGLNGTWNNPNCVSKA